MSGWGCRVPHGFFCFVFPSLHTLSLFPSALEASSIRRHTLHFCDSCPWFKSWGTDAVKGCVVLLNSGQSRGPGCLCPILKKALGSCSQLSYCLPSDWIPHLGPVGRCPHELPELALPGACSMGPTLMCQTKKWHQVTGGRTTKRVG